MSLSPPFQNSPFHAGERAIQQRLGVRDQIEPWARKVVRSFLPSEHQAFYAQLPFLVLAARDPEGRPWATLLAGEPGFASSPDPSRLRIEGQLLAGDALEGALARGADVGILGIETETRRRNRVNGRIVAGRTSGSSAIEIAVEQTFGNCPQHIQVRESFAASAVSRPLRIVHDQLDEALVRFIEGADTFFIATGHRDRGEHAAFGMDASHRGGPAGFVRVVSERVLVFEDFAGNNHFNTLGNLELDPRAGLLFVDFERGGLLQLSGRARVDWQGDGRREIRFELDRAIELRDGLPLRWRCPASCRSVLQIASKRRESQDVVSFELESERDPEGRIAALADFAAGQHLPIEVEIDGQRYARSYSLSSPLRDGRYRISVKREAAGRVSRFLHDELDVGDRIRAGRPAGDFVLEAAGRPVVLVSAGVGITPLVAMLHELAPSAPTAIGALLGPRGWFVHGARDGRHHPLAAEVSAIVESSPGLEHHVAFSRPRPEDAGAFDSVGRVDAALLERLVPGLDADFYLCGPQAFLSDVIEGLDARGVHPDRIHWESFGAATSVDTSARSAGPHKISASLR